MGSPSSSKRILVWMAFVGALSLLTATCDAQLEETVQVQIKNNLNVPVGIRCYSDKGEKTQGQSVPPSGLFEFSFHTYEDIPTTKYDCGFRWQNIYHQYTIYYQPRETCAVCEWYITVDGPCHIDAGSRVSHCHKWDESSAVRRVSTGTI